MDRSYDNWLTAPLRQQHDKEHFQQHWLEECNKVLAELGYTDTQIDRLEDKVCEIIEEYRTKPKEQYDPIDQLRLMDKNTELEQELFFSRGE